MHHDASSKQEKLDLIRVFPCVSMCFLSGLTAAAQLAAILNTTPHKFPLRLAKGRTNHLKTNRKPPIAMPCSRLPFNSFRKVWSVLGLSNATVIGVAPGFRFTIPCLSLAVRPVFKGCLRLVSSFVWGFQFALATGPDPKAHFQSYEFMIATEFTSGVVEHAWAVNENCHHIHQQPFNMPIIQHANQHSSWTNANHSTFAISTWAPSYTSQTKHLWGSARAAWSVSSCPRSVQKNVSSTNPINHFTSGREILNTS